MLPAETIYKIQGGMPLKGEVTVQRAKNAILPMIAAALIPDHGQTVLRNVPDIEDVRAALDIVRFTGAKVEHLRDQHTVIIDASTVTNGSLDTKLTSQLRASVLFLAPLLTRLGYVELPSIGGCSIGERSIDFHHRGFARLGARVIVDDCGTILRLEKPRLTGNVLYLDTPSHTGTENLLMAGALAEGETLIENAAVDPEVGDFINFLTSCGAKISGAGTHTLRIQGVKKLNTTEHEAISDRLVVGTLMVAASITGGDVVLRDVRPEDLVIVIAKLRQMGVNIEVEDHLIRVQGPKEQMYPINIITAAYPGFPTDLQPCFAALTTVSNGTSFIRERIFEKRYDYVDGLNEMGADILISQNDVCVIRGVPELRAANIPASSIRAGAAILIAALKARGETVISNGRQIERGYEKIETLLSNLGGKIARETRA